MLFCPSEPHSPEVFHHLPGLCLQPPKRVHSAPPGFLANVRLNVLLHMSDPEQAAKLPVCSGLTDASLKSLPSKVRFSKALFSIVQEASARTTQTRQISSGSLSLSPSPHHLLSEHKNTLIL